MRLGFLGTGWIGCHRLMAVRDRGLAEIVAVADPSADRRAQALKLVPHARACEHLGHLLELPLDGIVIATPSALHAEQAIAALDRGIAVFCQKPLARDAPEAARVVAAARAADRLLGVDLSYRHTEAVTRIREVLRAGGIGKPFAIELVFHNAYGPDGAWFYDKARSGGGCVIDLGVHLVDLALWLLDYPAVKNVDAQLFAKGAPLEPGQVEDYAAVQLRLAGNCVVRLTCSWRISAGRDAVIGATLFGPEGGLSLTNVAGSFYDFIAEHHRGTQSARLASPPDPWGGRAINAWVDQLAAGARFDPAADRFIELSEVLDQIYGGAA